MHPVDPAALAAIPGDGLLLHIGVFKTGTTALQETLRHSPEVLSARDVLYRGPSSWRFAPLRNLARAGSAQWESLVGDLAAHTGRVVVSSENLCGCSDDEAADVVAALGGRRPVRILITVRALAELLPSTWQQLLKRGMSQPYDEWVAKVVADAPAGTGLFWRRNNFPAQVHRWGRLVGDGNVTVAVSDKRQPDRLLRVSEQLLALPHQSLQFTPDGKSNQSLSHADAELLRQVNAAAVRKLGEDEYQRLVRLGVFPAMHRNPRTGAAPIPLPAQAADEMSRIGREQAEALRATTATIIGDINDLGAVGGQPAGDATPPRYITIDTAAAAIVGALTAATRSGAAGQQPDGTPRSSTASRRRLLPRRGRG